MLSRPVAWSGFLRRAAFARALQGSNSIEDIKARLAEAMAIIDEDKPQPWKEQTEKGINSDLPPQEVKCIL